MGIGTELSSDGGSWDPTQGAESVDVDNQAETDIDCLGDSSADSSGVLSGVSGSWKEGRDVLLCIVCSSANLQEGLDNTDGRD